jgi:macrodomain Ter protein organizer (MatP/YcbG family)
MPFKSRAQRRKFAELLVKGKISPETFEEWNRETGGAKLPERVKQPARRRKKKSLTKSRTRKRSTKPRRRSTGRKKRPTT